MNDPNWLKEISENHAELLEAISTAVARGADAYVRLVLFPAPGTTEWLLACGRIDIARKGNIDLVPELDYGTARTVEHLMLGPEFIDRFSETLRGKPFNVSGFTLRNHGFSRAWKTIREWSPNRYSNWPIIHAWTDTIPERPRLSSATLFNKELPVCTVDDLTSRLTGFRRTAPWEDGRKDCAFIIIDDYRGRVVRTYRSRDTAMFDLEGTALDGARLAVRVESARGVEAMRPLPAAPQVSVPVPACDVTITAYLFVEASGSSETLDERLNEPMPIAQAVAEQSLKAALSTQQQVILDLAADYEASTGEATSHERIHVGFASDDDEQTDALILSLVPECLRYEVHFPYKTYRLTQEGWVRSKYTAQVSQLVAGTLSLFRDKLSAEPDFRSFTWQELMDRGLDLGFKDPSFAQIVLGRFELIAGGGGGNWGRPQNILKLAKVRALDELRKYHETIRAQAAQGVGDITATSDLHTDWNDVPEEYFGAFGPSELWAPPALYAPPDVSVTNLHFHSDVKVETTHSATFSNATIGAFSQGERPTATGTAEPGGDPSAQVGSCAEPVTNFDQRPERQAEAGAGSYSAHMSNSTLGASAQGPGSQAVGIINQHGLGYADVRQIADDRVKLAVERLREAVGQAHDRSMNDMLRVSFAVVQSLVAARLGAPPDAAAVAEFLQSAVEDPAFPTRAARLFQEGAKAPSASRRELLARALFGIPATTPERDRVDAAIERLFPEDVGLLRRLVSLAEKGGIKDHVYFRRLAHNGAHALRAGFQGLGGVTTWEPFPCNDWSLYSLQTVGCVSFGLSPETISGLKDITKLTILPLGHAVLVTLEVAGLRGPGEAGEQ